MRSIKPGRAPSWGGVFGGVIGVIFMIFWISMVGRIGAPPFFVFFGIVGLIAAVIGIFYHLHNATSGSRFSDWDITEGHEERDPLDPTRDRLPPTAPGGSEALRRIPGPYCPFCGTPVEQTFAFCPQCGKELQSP